MKIRSKLFLILLSSSTFLVLAMYLMMQWLVDKELLNYINLRQQQSYSEITVKLSESYRKSGSWQFLRDRPHTLGRLLQESTLRGELDFPSGPRHHPPMHDRPGGAMLQDRPGPPDDFRPDERAPRSGDRSQIARPGPPRIGPENQILVLDSQKAVVVGRYYENEDYSELPILMGGQTIGWLAFLPPKHPTEDFDLALQESLTTGFLSVSVLIILLSAALAMPITYLVVRRIKALAEGTHAISKGQYQHRVVVDSSDEITQLCRDFNNLALTLEQNETARKRWIADISHELRTPLSITSGELEAMEDGVRALSVENVRSAREEIKHLQHLVDDLYELTNADIGALSYNKHKFDLAKLIRHEVDSYSLLADSKGLSVELLASEHAIEIWADMSRIKQLIQNLLGNSAKYTDAPGKVRVIMELKPKGENVVASVVIEDSSPGVDGCHLKKLFDHLYRVEGSRNRQTGGSGLGLAICKQIVKAHDGEINASASELGGLKLSLEFPLAG